MKHVRFIILMLFFSGTIYSQTGKLHLGGDVKTGISWIKSNESNIETYQVLPVIKYGFHGDYFFAERYSAMVGIYFSHMGGYHRYNFNDNQSFTLKGDDDNPKLESGDRVKYRLKYLEIPVSVKMMTEKINKFYYFAKTGFDIRTRLSVDAERKGSVSKSGINAKDEITLFDMGWHIGMGLEYPVKGSTALQFSLEYGQGFIDITTDEGDSVEDVSRNNYLTINVSLIF